jgi:hypothetical protein
MVAIMLPAWVMTAWKLGIYRRFKRAAVIAGRGIDLGAKAVWQTLSVGMTSERP